jgi:hypothetical protein
MIKIIIIFVMLHMSFIGSSLASPMFNDGNGHEWRQITETINVSWFQLDSVCANDGQTECEGVVGSIDVDGWIWATANQVINMFMGFDGFPVDLDPGPHGFYGNPVDGNFFNEISAVFDPTTYVIYSWGFTPYTWRLDGLTADLSDSLGWSGSAHFVADGSYYRVFSLDGQAPLYEGSYPIGGHDSSPRLGAWMFRNSDPQSIPEPSTLSLILGLLLLRFGFYIRRVH